MATKELRVRVKHAYLSAAEWFSKDPILQAGEFGIENDTQKFKIGDGVKKWSNLPYVSGITVDESISSTSTNPVQNKVIKGALDDKANLNKNNTFSKENYFQKGMSLIAYRDLDSAIKWYQSPVNPPIAFIDATNYTGIAAKATSDGAGNVITKTYAKKADVSGVVKSVNGTKPDANGNVTISIPTVTIEEMKAMFTLK